MRLGLRQIDRALKRTVLFCIDKPTFVLGAAALVIAASIASATRLHQSVSIRDQLDPAMASTRELKTLDELFPDDANLILLLQPSKGGFDSRSLCESITRISDVERGVPGVSVVATPLSPRRADWQRPNFVRFPRLVADPCKAGTPELAHPLEGLRGSPWLGSLTDQKAEEPLFYFHVAPLAEASRQGRFNARAMKDFVGRVDAKLGTSVAWLGSAAQEYFMMKGLESGQLLNLAVVVVIFLGFRFLFGTWLAGMLFLVTLGFTGAVIAGGMALLGHATDALSSCLFIMLAVATVEDLVFVSHYRASGEASWKRAFLKLALPGFFTSLTTMIGFGSLASSSLVSIARFGGWACLGSFLEWAAIFLILPALCSCFPRLSVWTRPERAFGVKGTSHASRWVPPRWISRACLLVFPLAFVASHHFRVAQDPSEIFARSHPARKAWEHAREVLGWKANASLLFRDGVSEERKREIVQGLEKSPAVARVETYESIFSYVTRGIDDRGILDMIDRWMKDPSGRGKDYFAESGEERALLFLSTTATDELSDLRARAGQLCPAGECVLTGDFIAFADYSQSFIRTLFESLFLSLALVAVILLWLSRGLGANGFVSITLASFWGPACTLGVMGLIGTSINSITCVVASTVVGLTGDNAVQYLFSSGRGRSLSRGMDRMGPASIQSALLMIAICLVLLGSEFAPVKELSVLFVIGFVASLVGDLWLLRGLQGSDSRLSRAIQAEAVSLVDELRFSLRHPRYFGIALILYSQILTRPRHARGMRLGYALLQSIDDVLDGHRPCEDPDGFAAACKQALLTNTYPMTARGALWEVVARELIGDGPEAPARRELFARTIDAMRVDYRRRMGREAWSRERIEGQLRETFECSLRVLFLSMGESFDVRRHEASLRLMGWCSEIRDLDDDLGLGLINVPEDVLREARVAPAELARAEGIARLKASAAFRGWLASRLAGAERDCGEASAALEREPSPVVRKVLGIFFGSGRKYVGRLRAQMPKLPSES